MAKVRLAIEKSKPLKNGEHMIVMLISSKGEVVRVSTEVQVSQENWDNITGQVKGGKKCDTDAMSKNGTITRLKNACDLKILSNKEKVAKMNVKQLKSFLLGDQDPLDSDFFRFIDKRIQEVTAQNRTSTVKLLTAVRNKVQSFWVVPTLDLNQINIRWLEQFETYCKRPVKEGENRKTMSTNGVAVYMRYLRILMNDALDEELIDKYPFRKYRIKMTGTKNRDISIKDVRKIRDAVFEDPEPYKKPDPALKKKPEPRPLSKKRMETARDIWLLSLYLSGISPKDLFYLKNSDIVAGRIEFNRFKTTTPYSIKIEPEAQAIIEKYRGEKYLLKFADYSITERTDTGKKHARKSSEQWKDETQFGKHINKGMHQIQKDLGIVTSNLTLYSARHTIGTLLRTIDETKDTVSLVLGHISGSKITDIYINKKEIIVKVDKAMRKLIDEINL